MRRLSFLNTRVSILMTSLVVLFSLGYWVAFSPVFLVSVHGTSPRLDPTLLVQRFHTHFAFVFVFTYFTTSTHSSLLE